ncbi:MAG: threonine synthase [Frankiaceae bacterium]
MSMRTGVSAAFSTLDHLECGRCGREHDADRPAGTCTGCGGPLLARYDLGAVGAAVSPSALAGRPPDLWRYHELLPVRSPDRVVTLGEGMTPLVAARRLGEQLGVPRLLVKDEGLLPTGSFKARGAAVGVSRAAELGARSLAMPTNGNAGAAWAAYAARAGLAMSVAMPVDAPRIARVECALAGADLTLVRGLIGDAARWLATSTPPGAYDVATLKEPYRIEGKKTMGFEIAEQLGWRLPDVVVYPTGGGVGLITIHKAMLELIALGWVDGPLPRFVAVQASGCAPIVEAFRAGAAESRPWSGARTVAFGITVPKAFGDFLVLRALYETGGTAVAVDDERLLADQRLAAGAEGMLCAPEGAAALSAVRELAASGWIGRDDEVVVLNTGTALLYPDVVRVEAPEVDPPAAG